MKNRIYDAWSFIMEAKFFDPNANDVDKRQLYGLRWLHSFRFEIQHFVTSISNYLNLKFLEAEAQFTEALSSISEKRSFHSIHSDYLGSLLRFTFQSSDMHSQEVKSCIEFLNIFVLEFRTLVISFEHLSEVGLTLLRDQQKQFQSIVVELKKALHSTDEEHELLAMLS